MKRATYEHWATTLWPAARWSSSAVRMSKAAMPWLRWPGSTSVWGNAVRVAVEAVVGQADEVAVEVQLVARPLDVFANLDAHATFLPEELVRTL